jgi:aldose 1-epimerase
MPFQVRTATQPAADGPDGGVAVLEADGGAARAEVWPARGFNCYRWRVAHGERAFDLLYADPRLFLGARPTSGGVPILFPFPNRVRDARFTWDGKEHQLPRNDSEHVNAIHGFVFDRPWRVVDQGADGSAAWVTGAFRGSADAPDLAAFWPADYELRVTYRLAADSLRIEAAVVNPDTRPLPFGLGYHPYFRVPLVPNTSAADCRVEARAGAFWELKGFLPTGERRPVEGRLDLRTPRPFPGLKLDDVLTGLPDEEGTSDGMRLLGVVREPMVGAEVRLRAAPAFRELVLYTPGHRQAVCLEPYTCATDAVNLQERGIDAGWQVLPPGGRWSADVVMALASV